MTNALRTTGSPKVPLIATICSFVTNAVFNYVFIFGKFGAPALGVVGAAVATLIARVVEVSVLFLCGIFIQWTNSTTNRSLLASYFKRLMDELLDYNLSSYY